MSGQDKALEVWLDCDRCGAQGVHARIVWGGCLRVVFTDNYWRSARDWCSLVRVDFYDHV